MGRNNERARPASEGGGNRPGAWSAYGKLVRLFREREGLTQQSLADAIGYSLEQVASVEQGRRPAKAAFTGAAERVLKAGGALDTLQEDVGRAQLPAFFQDVAALELEAISRFSYDQLVIPGLLQMEAYARALIQTHFPPLDDEIVEQRVAARLARQSILTRRTPLTVLAFVIEEVALHRMVGGPQVMRAQLAHLLECSCMRHVDIQVMPNSRAAHSGLSGPMVLLETDVRQRFVVIESQGVVSVRSGCHEVSEFWLQYGMLRSQALNAEDSADLIKRAAGET
ncbi:helix-turn-helix transcriptional regulator [Streptomyces verrucosisporus]|uniref:helix-turn-helix domain-containing protein n=1 Tax=Streptomyces verrucosisporus TaxID=1695161 RepID=UPI0019D2CFC7|nr:helix-turn-helix transcriptional regulator [Streptomyces verrucosisporus]MBN3931683.1 helix-turn-helix transcriptional regulator [Streptomyces verrucosisporus]